MPAGITTSVAVVGTMPHSQLEAVFHDVLVVPFQVPAVLALMVIALEFTVALPDKQL